ncbi:hypothetical protein [Psychromonas sp. MME1]|uniref:hypothetical protein n=1 Tax=Psychromonas sp. MME1 TaxID=3231032 RepID=UPI0034E2BC82
MDKWTHYSVTLKDLVNYSGSTLDLRNVNAPFAILPDWGNQRGVVLMIDNVRMSN